MWRKQIVIPKGDVMYRQSEKTFGKWFGEWLYDDIGKNPNAWSHNIPEFMRKEFIDYVNTRNSNRYKWIMVTINFKENVTIKDMMKKVVKLIGKKWIKSYMHTFECRSAQMLPCGSRTYGGVHWHGKLEIDEKKNAYECKRECFNTVKNLVGNELHVNVRYSNIEGCFEGYIKGIKMVNGFATKKSLLDDDFRKKWGLKSYYVG